MSHYCISNPCWICYPEFAPKQNDDKYHDFWTQKIQSCDLPNDQISGMLQELLIAVFKQGLDEDEHFRSIDAYLNLEKIKMERSKISDDSLEAKLLDLMIEDFDWKSNCK